MLDLLTVFFRDWLPSIAIVIGGSFAWWRWYYSERLRRQREIPIADLGTLSATPAKIANTVLVQLDALWRNPGRVPFEVDTKRTVIEVFKIAKDLEPGPIQVRRDPSDLGIPAFVSKPFERSKSLILEPGADSLVQSHFALPTEGLFLFRWKLYRWNDEGRRLSRTRFLLLDTATLQTTITPPEQGAILEDDQSAN